MIDGFTVEHWMNRKPIEDSYAFDNDKGIMIVADGITRDPKGMPILPGSKFDLYHWYKFFKNYPNSSPAKKAADLFCKTALEYMRSHKDRNNFTIQKAFEEGNEALHRLNKKENPEIDFLENDFYGCVAAIAVVQDERLSWGYIADCGIAVLDNEGDLVYRTMNEGPSSEIGYMVKNVHETEFRYPEGRRTIRRVFRNNPGNSLAYGALTGESIAMYYVRTRQRELNSGESIVVYSDGLEHVLGSRGFKSGISKRNINKLKRTSQKEVKTEGTAVVSFPELKEVA